MEGILSSRPSGDGSLDCVAFVGGGLMAEAIIRGLLERGLVRPDGVCVGEPVPERRGELAARHGVRTTPANGEAVEGASLVVLAVKPQHVEPALSDLRGRLDPRQLVVSIVAGVPLDTLIGGLAHRSVVRVMPNTPAQVGEGISVWTATPEVGEAGRALVRSVLGALGEEVEVADERYIDMATALSGSGPGYVFLFLEALVDAGVHLGFARPVAEKLVYQTALGSVVMARETGRHPAELRNAVTSPAGTTAAGLAVLEEGRLRAAIDRCVFAAYERCLELGRKK
jgi:pyrroline-5-carboxylate reductase